MVEAVNLRRIADNRTERVQVVVELPLQVGRGFHLLLGPYMPRGLHQHDPLLILQLLLCLVRVGQYHSGQHGVILCPCLGKADAQQQKTYRECPFHRQSGLV